MCQSVVVRVRTHTTHILFMSVIYLKLPWPGTKKRYRRFRRLLNRLDVFFCAPINMDERHVYIHFRLVVWRKNGIVIVCGLWVEKIMCGMRERCLWIFVKILLFLGSRWFSNESCVLWTTLRSLYGMFDEMSARGICVLLQQGLSRFEKCIKEILIFFNILVRISNIRNKFLLIWDFFI